MEEGPRPESTGGLQEWATLCIATHKAADVIGSASAAPASYPKWSGKANRVTLALL
jgi:hypothetical protein